MVSRISKFLSRTRSSLFSARSRRLMLVLSLLPANARSSTSSAASNGLMRIGRPPMSRAPPAPGYTSSASTVCAVAPTPKVKGAKMRISPAIAVWNQRERSSGRMNGPLMSSRFSVPHR